MFFSSCLSPIVRSSCCVSEIWTTRHTTEQQSLDKGELNDQFLFILAVDSSTHSEILRVIIFPKSRESFLIVCCCSELKSCGNWENFQRCRISSLYEWKNTMIMEKTWFFFVIVCFNSSFIFLLLLCWASILVFNNWTKHTKFPVWTKKQHWWN